MGIFAVICKTSWILILDTFYSTRRLDKIVVDGIRVLPALMRQIRVKKLLWFGYIWGEAEAALKISCQH